MSDTRCRDRGSVLMLMPAALLVLFVLAGITFDYAHLYLAQRELQSAAEAAVNDAVTWGVDQGSVRRGGGPVLDETLVEQAVDASLATHGASLDLDGPPVVEALSATEVRVTVTGRVDYLFVPAVPGLPRSTTVRATAVATLSPPA